jgi:hypothetical protein
VEEKTPHHFYWLEQRHPARLVAELPLALVVVDLTWFLGEESINGGTYQDVKTACIAGM